MKILDGSGVVVGISGVGGRVDSGALAVVGGVQLVPESELEAASLLDRGDSSLRLSDLSLRVDFLQAKLNKLLISISAAGDASKVVDDLDLEILESETDEKEKDDGVVVARERGGDYDLLRDRVKRRRVGVLESEDEVRIRWGD